MRAGVAALAKALADEWAPAGIRVNHLIPGRIATERVAALDADTAQRRGVSLDEAQAGYEAQIPLGRYGTVGGVRPGGGLPAVRRRRLHHRGHAQRRRRDDPADRLTDESGLGGPGGRGRVAAG